MWAQNFARQLPGRWRVLYAVAMKAVATTSPPIQWIGGQIFELHKGNGPANQVQSYREVTCCSCLGKPFASHLRTAAYKVLQCRTSPGQTGSGLGGGGTDMARLWAAAAVDWAHSVSSSVALLFIDLSSAFASIVREVVLPMPTSADETCTSGFLARSTSRCCYSMPGGYPSL